MLRREVSWSTAVRGEPAVFELFAAPKRGRVRGIQA
jgi:hypothetical protein